MSQLNHMTNYDRQIQMCSGFSSRDFKTLFLDMMHSYFSQSNRAIYQSKGHTAGLDGYISGKKQIVTCFYYQKGIN